MIFESLQKYLQTKMLRKLEVWAEVELLRL